MEHGPHRQLFDVWSRFYDLPLVQHAVYRSPQDAVLAEVRRGPGTILDVGCGTGLLVARLRRKHPRARVIGCDFSPGMLAQARTRGAGAAWVQADAGRLPFRDGSIDMLVSTEAFHWFPDRRAALAEFRRVLRPGGRLLLALVNPRLAFAGRVVSRLSAVVGEPFYWPTMAEMRRDVRAAGLRVQRQVPIFRVPGALLFPSVLTVALRPRARRNARTSHA